MLSFDMGGLEPRKIDEKTRFEVSCFWAVFTLKYSRYKLGFEVFHVVLGEAVAMNQPTGLLGHGVVHVTVPVNGSHETAADNVAN